MIFGDLRDIKTEKHVTEVMLKRKPDPGCARAKHFPMLLRSEPQPGSGFLMRQPQLFLPETTSAYFFLAGDIM